MLEHEAGDFVARLAAELRSKHPERFAQPPKWWELNWRAVKIYLIFEICAFVGIWLFLPSFIGGRWAMKLLGFGVGFMAGAACFLPLRLKVPWKIISVLLCGLLPAMLAAYFFRNDAFLNYFEGTAFGACMIIAGCLRKRRKI